ncbi:MAG: hypothetical protein EA399_07880 [Desulfovibrionales bacterium]|nr:MAG: hypothetical protein EA399_07880 [Desulfovibrionales bacterium]
MRKPQLDLTRSLPLGQLIVMVLLAWIASGCVSPAQQPIPADGGHASLVEHVAEIRALRDRQQALNQGRSAAEPLQPILPVADPLDGMRVTLSAQDQRLTDVLYALADSVGLSLVINPDVRLADRVTIRLVDTPASTVLDSLLASHDVAYERRDNFLVIQRYIEQAYELGFLNREVKVSLDAGGDILGNTNLMSRGNDRDTRRSESRGTNAFKISSSMGQGITDNSLYGMLHSNIQDIIGSHGNQDASGQYFTLDPTAGTLYVRATPSRHRAVADLVRNIKRKVSRQVVIDAWMVEVRLSSEYRLGVDWQLLTHWLSNLRGVRLEAGWNAPVGGQSPMFVAGASTIGNEATAASATMEALERFGQVSLISSPHVRVKHGQPALFTSGRTQNYVHSLSRDRAIDVDRETFSVEVRSLFDGIMLGVVPYVDDHGVVDLHVYPVESQVNPASLELVDITGSGDRITLPEVSVRNITTNVRARDGDTVVLGGLIGKTDSRNRSGLIAASRFPLTGVNTGQANISELVIIMDIRVVD